MRIRNQETVCEWQKVQPEKPDKGSIVGVAIDTFKNNISSIYHGIRHNPIDNTNGWYLWKGEYEERANFFQPICFEHLSNHISTDIIQYLDLPPGYRFLVNGSNYEDVWFDKGLLLI